MCVCLCVLIKLICFQCFNLFIKFSFLSLFTLCSVCGMKHFNYFFPLFRDAQTFSLYKVTSQADTLRNQALLMALSFKMSFLRVLRGTCFKVFLYLSKNSWKCLCFVFSKMTGFKYWFLGKVLGLWELTLRIGSINDLVFAVAYGAWDLQVREWIAK